jgi:hypothetical protein
MIRIYIIGCYQIVQEINEYFSVYTCIVLVIIGV